MDREGFHRFGIWLRIEYFLHQHHHRRKAFLLLLQNCIQRAFLEVEASPALTVARWNPDGNHAGDGPCGEVRGGVSEG
jgi:hypothetical protein